MTAQKHLAAINRAVAQLSTAREKLDSVQADGAQAVTELDALNAAENADPVQVNILESRLRGFGAKRAARLEAISKAEAALSAAVEEAFAALQDIAQSGPEIAAAANAVMPWSRGSMEAARKVVLMLPAFTDRTRDVNWLWTRKEKTDPEEIVPALIKFLEAHAGDTPDAVVTA